MNFNDPDFDKGTVWDTEAAYMNGLGGAVTRQELACNARSVLQLAAKSFSAEFRAKVHKYTPARGHPQFTRSYEEWYRNISDYLTYFLST
jgi:hypothetical protein